MNIIFVCLGNICRSPMAEFVMKDMLDKAGLLSYCNIISRATSDEEEGNGIHYGTRKILDQKAVPYEPRRATVITKKEYEWADLVVCMEDRNLRSLKWIIGSDEKTEKLLSRNVADPYYTGNFDITYRDIKEGCEILLERIKARYFSR